MADTWEDDDVAVSQPPKPSPALNPNAPSFSFNPSASSFTPSFTPQAPAAAPAHQPSPPRAPQLPSTASVTHAAGHPASDIDMVDAGPVGDGGGDTDMEPTSASAGHEGDAHASASASVTSATARMNGLTVSEGAPARPSLDEGRGKAKAAAEPDDDDDLEPEEERNLELKRIADELAKEDGREHMNIVFIGHVDAGKSTTGGQILYLTGGVDKRTIEKYEKEAKDKNRESWYMAYIMDTNEEERAKGKTVEVGRAQFQTEKKRYTILDAPGHKNYVPNMISGASQADIGVLVIAARKGEFETGFERGGQTREHAQLARTLGVAKLIIAINKMDDPSVAGPNGEWSKQRYDEIVEKLGPFLKSCGYKKTDLIFLPMSGLMGDNIKDKVDPKRCPWYQGGTLFEVLDGVEPLPRDPLAPFRMSVIDKYKDMGTIAMGKSESGIVRKGDRLYVMPNKVSVQVTTIYRDDDEVSAANCGENLRLRLTGIDEDELQSGFVICSRHKPVPCVTYFDAQLQILDLLEHKAIFTAGYKAILHLHSLVEECEVTNLIAQIDKKTGEKKKAKFVKSSSAVIARIAVEKPICAELFSVVPQLGRFTLRDEGRTIAIGKIVKLPKSLKQGTEAK